MRLPLVRLPGAVRPYTTVYNRFNRWSRKGIWQSIYAALTGDRRTLRQLLADSTHVKAHHSGQTANTYEIDIPREFLLPQAAPTVRSRIPPLP